MTLRLLKVVVGLRHFHIIPFLFLDKNYENNTLVPTEIGVGLTSACLGLIYALECQGVKAGFLKPFHKNYNLKEYRTTALYRHLFKHETVEPISYTALTQRLKMMKMTNCLKMLFVYIVKFLNITI